MNRRNFLKSLGAACGAAVVCPAVLLKSPVEFRPNPVQRIYMIDHPVFRNVIKTQQNDMPYGIPYWCGTQQHFMGRRSGFIVMRPE